MTVKKRPNQAPKADAKIDAEAVMTAVNVILANALESVAGVVAGATGLTVEQAAGLAASDTQHKTDVNVPEVITSLNGMVMQQAVNHGHALQLIETQMIEQGSFFADLLRERAVDHADQNHTKQMLAVTFPFIVAGDAAEESADDSDK
jgi:hypothetical protein